jgi:F0F1-type ATP synthase membrane subunit c/vacuolar-type H+-ATPase subunit K
LSQPRDTKPTFLTNLLTAGVVDFLVVFAVVFDFVEVFVVFVLGEFDFLCYNFEY